MDSQDHLIIIYPQARSFLTYQNPDIKILAAHPPFFSQENPITFNSSIIQEENVI